MTTSKSEYTPRFGIDITPEMKERLSTIPWGLRSELFRVVLDNVLDCVESDVRVIGLLAQKRLKFVLEEVNDGDNK